MTKEEQNKIDKIENEIIEYINGLNIFEFNDLTDNWTDEISNRYDNVYDYCKIIPTEDLDEEELTQYKCKNVNLSDKYIFDFYGISSGNTLKDHPLYDSFTRDVAYDIAYFLVCGKPYSGDIDENNINKACDLFGL